MKDATVVSDQDRLRAMHQVQLAVDGIMARHRLLGAVLRGMLVEVTPTVSTVMTSMRDGRLLLTVHPRWAAYASFAALEGALIHEVNHLLLGHHEIDGAGFDGSALDIAKDLTANEYNDREAPAGTATLDDFPGFPLGESVFDRYARVIRHVDQVGNTVSRFGNGDGAEQQLKESEGGSDSDDDDNDQTSAGGSTSGSDGSRSSEDGIADAEHGTAFQDSTNASSNIVNSAERAERHRDPEMASNALMVRAILAATVRHMAPGDLSAQERGMLIQIKDPIGLCGQGTSRDIGLLEPSDRDGAMVAWKRALRRYVGEAMPVPRPNYARPSRRFPELLGIVPGSASCPGKPIIQAVIDTSGSMSDADLCDIAAELRYLRRGRRIIVVQCDCGIQSVERFSGRIDRCVGRGGTDFRPVFEPSLLRRTRAELIIVFTDGCGPAPEDQPRVPVIWALTQPYTPPAQWGKVIRLPEREP